CLETGTMAGRKGPDASSADAAPTNYVETLSLHDALPIYQQRAIVHPDTTSSNETKTLSAANLVVLTATATDGDGDHASAPLNIRQQQHTSEHSHSHTSYVVGAPTLTVDESVLTTDATGGF